MWEGMGGGVGSWELFVPEIDIGAVNCKLSKLHQLSL